MDGVVAIRRSDAETVKNAINRTSESVQAKLPNSRNTDLLAKLQGRWNVEQRHRLGGVLQSDVYTAFVLGSRIEFQASDGQVVMMFDFVIGNAGPPQQIDLKPVLSDVERQELMQGWGDNDEQPPEGVLHPIFYGIIDSDDDTLHILVTTRHRVPLVPFDLRFVRRICG